MTLQELIGSSYKDNITVEEIITAISGKTYVDNSNNEYVVKQTYDDINKKYMSLLTEEEKNKIIREQHEKEFADLKRKVSKSSVISALSKAGYNDIANDLIETLITDDEAQSIVNAERLINSLNDVKKKAENYYNAALLNGSTSTPQSGGKQEVNVADMIFGTKENKN